MGRALALAACVAGWACEFGPVPSEGLPDHELVDALTAPPLNRPVGQLPIPVAPVLPSPTPLDPIVATAGGALFFGEVSSSGVLSLDGGIIEFVSDDGGLRVEVLPPVPVAIPTSAGQVQLSENSNPGGADRTIVLRQDGVLVLGEVWRSSDAPISTDFGDVVFQQVNPVGLPPGSGSVEVPLEVLANGEVIGAPPGVVTDVRSLVGPPYRVFVETNLVSTGGAEPPPLAGEPYVLHAWVLRGQAPGGGP